MKNQFHVIKQPPTVCAYNILLRRLIVVYTAESISQPCFAGKGKQES